MISRVIKKTWIPLVVIGTILTALWLFGGIENWTVITKQNFNIGTYNWTFYSFDIRRYLLNIQNTIKPDYILMSFNEYYPQIPPTPDWTNIVSILKFLANCFIWVPNLFIYITNFTVLGVIKLLIYPFNILFTLIGINTTNISYVQIVNNIINFNIEYINYV